METLSPLSDEINVPEYIHAEWKQRNHCNKCFYSLYRILRTLFSSFWFYYAPFVALNMMFIVPYFIEEKKEAIVDGGSMDEEYEQWLASQIQNSEYTEPPVDELIEIMNQVKIPEDDEGGEWI